MPRCNRADRAGFTGDTEPTGVCRGCADFCVVWVDERACQKPRRGQLVMDFKSDAAPARRREAVRCWQHDEASTVDQSVRRLQASIVQVGEHSMTQRRCAFVCISLTGS